MTSDTEESSAKKKPTSTRRNTRSKSVKTRNKTNPWEKTSRQEIWEVKQYAESCRAVAEDRLELFEDVMKDLKTDLKSSKKETSSLKTEVDRRGKQFMKVQDKNTKLNEEICQLQSNSAILQAKVSSLENNAQTFEIQGVAKQKAHDADIAKLQSEHKGEMETFQSACARRDQENS